MRFLPKGFTEWVHTPEASWYEIWENVLMPLVFAACCVLLAAFMSMEIASWLLF